MADRASRSPLRLALGWLGWWLVLVLLWIALFDATPTPALVAGALGAALGATAATAVDALGFVALRLRPAWLAGFRRPIARILPDTAKLTGALARRLAGGEVTGATTELSFRGGDDAVSRSLMVKLAGSLAPGAYVVRIDEEEQKMVVHTLPAADDPRRAVDPLGLS